MGMTGDPSPSFSWSMASCIRCSSSTLRIMPTSSLPTFLRGLAGASVVSNASGVRARRRDGWRTLCQRFPSLSSCRASTSSHLLRASGSLLTRCRNFSRKKWRRMRMVTRETDDREPLRRHNSIISGHRGEGGTYKHMQMNRMTCCHLVRGARRAEFRPVTVKAEVQRNRQSM
jgi:hypothetical protein